MFYDRALSVAVTCNGTGNATWTAAKTQCQLPPTSINETVIYTMLDSGGSAWETGRATLSESTGTYTLTRGGSQTVTDSSNSGSAVTFTNSSAHTLFLSADAQFYRNAEVHLETKTASSSASIDFDLPAGFSEYKLRLRDVAPATDAVVFELEGSTDGGSTYLNTSGDYHHAYYALNSGAAGGDNRSETTTTGIRLAGNVGNASTESCSGELVLAAMGSTSLHKMVSYKIVAINGNGQTTGYPGVGSFNTTSAVDNIRLAFDSGNISSGTFKLYGIVD